MIRYDMDARSSTSERFFFSRMYAPIRVRPCTVTVLLCCGFIMLCCVVLWFLLVCVPSFAVFSCFLSYFRVRMVDSPIPLLVFWHFPPPLALLLSASLVLSGLPARVLFYPQISREGKLTKASRTAR